MNNFLLIWLISIFSPNNIIELHSPGAPAIIKQMFHNEFPNIEKAEFFNVGDSTFAVYFKQAANNLTERVYYNSDAELTMTMKSYSESGLEPFIRERVNRKFKGKSIYIVTELFTETEHFYDIIVKDNTSWVEIKYDSDNTIEIQKRGQGNL